MIFLFVDVALRAASTLEKPFFVLFNILQVAKHLYLVGLKHQEYAKTLSFEKYCRM